MNMNARKHRPNITINALMFLVIYAIDDEKQGGCDVNEEQHAVVDQVGHIIKSPLQ